MLNTETIDLEAEQQRLREQMEEVAEEQLKWEDNPRRSEKLLVQGNELNNQRNILAQVQEEWGLDSITLRGLSAGDISRVEDTVEENGGVRERDAWVALGTVEGPYLEHDPEAVAQEDYIETVGNVTDLPLAFVRWAEGKISDLSHLSEAEGNGYAELLQEKRREQTDERDG